MVLCKKGKVGVTLPNISLIYSFTRPIWGQLNFLNNEIQEVFDVIKVKLNYVSLKGGSCVDYFDTVWSLEFIMKGTFSTRWLLFLTLIDFNIHWYKINFVQLQQSLAINQIKI